MEILLFSILGALIIAFIATKYSTNNDKSTQDPESVEPPPADCCGAHEVCEKLNLTVTDSSEIIYFEDEELDRFKDKDPATYSAEESEIFREVLETMKPFEVSEWLKSLRLRRIKLPPQVREEALAILRKQRA